MQAKLIPVDQGETVHITSDMTVVGRKKGLCDLVIDHPSISKLHCLIARTDGLLFIRDLGSTNGTKVNGQKVLRGAILPGDELSFAKVKYSVFLGPDQPDEESPTPEVSFDDRTEVNVPQVAAQDASHEAEQEVFKLLDKDEAESDSRDDLVSFLDDEDL